jgi:hypothetical protein
VRFGLFNVFRTQQHLVFSHCLRHAAEAMPPHLLDNPAQPVVLRYRSASSIAFNAPGSSGSASLGIQKSFCRSVRQSARFPDSPRRRNNHKLGCSGAAVSRAP